MDKKPEPSEQDVKGELIKLSRDQVDRTEWFQKSRDDVPEANIPVAERPLLDLLKSTQAEQSSSPSPVQPSNNADNNSNEEQTAKQ